MHRLLLLVTVPLILSSPAAALDADDTRLLGQPAISRAHLAFVYADHLWVADRDGKNARRLTGDLGAESNPVFSPDGRLIAFSANYDGNTDVYTVPVEGGTPTRLTWHPGADVVRGFTPDGKAVLFSSARAAFTTRHTQLFTVPVRGGFPTQLPIPHGVQASYSPDGESIAYTPLADRSGQWKHYRGGTCSRIWLYRFKDRSVIQIPQPRGRCNDTDPHWIGGTVYFRSDRGGEFNLFAYDCAGKSVRQLTRHADFPVVSVNSGDGQLVYEQAGYLHRFDPSVGRPTRLKVGVAAQLADTRPRYVRGAKYLRNASLSPSGARAAFEFRGEIVTVPAKKGDARNLTNSPGTHERDPAWSPDGKSVAYFSDQGGEYALHVADQHGKGKPCVYALGGAGFYDTPAWSPDGKKIAFRDNSQSLFWIDLGTGAVKKVASEALYYPNGLRALRYSWSPDSRWLAYTAGNRAYVHSVYAYSLADGKSRRITDGLSDVAEPAFDAGGKYLYFFASTEAGPVKQWFAQSSADMRARRSIYLAVLRKGDGSPFARESDEEKGEPEKPGKPKGAPKADGKPGRSPAEDFRIDFDGLDQRILALPLPAGYYSGLQAGPAGQVFFLERSEEAGRAGAPPPAKLKRFDLDKRKAEELHASVTDYRLAAGGKKVLTFTAPETWAIAEVAAGMTPGKGKLNLDAVEVRVEPRAEWRQMFDEVWRINRDYFYDPKMHGADWPAMRKKYAAFLPHLAARSDLDRVLRGLLSELAVGHSYLSPGAPPSERKPVKVGLLGADYEVVNGRYRFKKVYGGLNWSPELRSPLTVPGVEVKAGEYLLAVRGRAVRPPANLYSLFEGTAGKGVEITVGPSADGKGSRTVLAEPVESEAALRNRDWVEGNLRKVHRATGGRVAYVYVPNTARLGHEYFKRYFFPQVDKEALIIDERFNGGGQVADYYIDHLRRPLTSYWATRYGEDIRTPGAAIHGPKVMLIDETAGSGGDLLPWMFRKYKLGKLVGRRTWGGLVGILGFPVLMDGGRVTAPNLAFWTEEGWRVENEGVPPDVEVEQWPVEVLAGKDPQLEKAIELTLAELARKPSRMPKRPPYPVRVK